MEKTKMNGTTKMKTKKRSLKEGASYRDYSDKDRSQLSIAGASLHVTMNINSTIEAGEGAHKTFYRRINDIDNRLKAAVESGAISSERSKEIYRETISLERLGAEYKDDYDLDKAGSEYARISREIAAMTRGFEVMVQAYLENESQKLQKVIEVRFKALESKIP